MQSTFKKPTFKEQYDKIVLAYLQDKLRPFKGCVCFVGNLLDGDSSWEHSRLYISHGRSTLHCPRSSKLPDEANCGEYTPAQILNLENNFLKVLDYGDPHLQRSETGLLLVSCVYTEENLFKAMESTLLLLRQIHESRGEVIEDYAFTQRKLQTV